MFGPHPQFSISQSRAKLLPRCARAYFYKVYGGHLGWERGAPDQTKLIYRLGKLSTLDMVMGIAVHARATEIASAIIEGKAVPTPVESYRRARNAMNTRWKQRDHTAFARQPKRRPMLLEHYYRIPASNNRLARLGEKLQRCIDNLYSWRGWDEVRGADPAQILLLDPKVAVDFDGIAFHGAPDLVWHDGESWHITDFKTGKVDGVQTQIGIYALYLLLKGVIQPGDSIFGHGVGLNTAEEESFLITPVTIAAAEAEIRASIQTMRGYLIDQDLARNEALPPEAFPCVGGDDCRWCPFQEICPGAFEDPDVEGPF